MEYKIYYSTSRYKKLSTLNGCEGYESYLRQTLASNRRPMPKLGSHKQTNSQLLLGQPGIDLSKADFWTPLKVNREIH